MSISQQDRGYNRRSTQIEVDMPPDQRPWTEFDEDGNEQEKPDFKACPVKPCICFGSTLAVIEIQWCTWLCGQDADRCCDVLCRCRCERMQVGICCGPQCNDSCCSGCCSCDCCNCCAAMKVKGDNCCSCDCDCCTPKLFGCQTLCCHCTFVRCPRCCDCCCCCCVEEQLRMDGDCVPFPKKEVIDTQPTKQS